MNEDITLEQLEPIVLYKGATSDIEFDFSDFVFESNTKCLLTIKTMGDKEIYTQEFDEAKPYTVTFRDDFTINLKSKEYKYDIMYLINDERYPQCKPSKVIVKDVVGAYEPSN